MTTKDHCFLFKDKQNLVVNDNLNDKFKNLNLNQNNQCFAEITQSKNLENNNKAISNYDYSHKNDSQIKQNSTLFGKTKLKTSSANLNDHNDYGKREESKQGKILNANSSTLSLHITAYENSMVATTGDTINNEKDETNKKKGNTSSIKNWKAVKEIFSDSSVKYAFELPRQQQDENNDPEVMQFKASQRLSNVNQPHPSVIGPSSAATNTVSQQPPPATVNPAPSSSNSNLSTRRMLKDMHGQKYKAILSFFNAIAELLKLKHAKDFRETYKYQLSAVLKVLKLNDSFNADITPEDDPFKMSKEIFEAHDSGIDFLVHLIPFKEKDEICIGKLLVAIIYHLKLIKPDLLNSALQQLDDINQSLEIQHIILYIENKEQWPVAAAVDGWPNVLITAAPCDLHERIRPFSTSSSHSTYISRTPLRRSMRQSMTLSPYKRVATDSPITKTMVKELTKRNQVLTDQILKFKIDYETLGQSHDELLVENKKYQQENQKLKHLVEENKEFRHDFHSVNEEMKKLKSEKENLQKEVQMQTETNRSLKDELKGCYKELEEYNSTINDKERQIELLQNMNESSTQQLADLNEEIIELRNDRDILQKKSIDTENVLNQLRRDYEMMKKQNNEMSRMSLNVTDISNINLADENQRLRDQITQLSKKFEDESDEKNQEFAKKENFLNAEIERLNLKLTEVVRENEKRKADIENYKRIENDKDAEILKYRSQIAELTGQVQGLKDNADEWRIKYENEQQSLAKAQEDNGNLIKSEEALKCEISDMKDKIQALNDTAEDWKLKYEQENQNLEKAQEDNENLLKKVANLEETILIQNNDLDTFKRKEIGALVRKVFYDNTSTNEQTAITSPEEPPSLHVKKLIYREKQDFYNRSK